MKPFLQTKIMQKARKKENPETAVITGMWQMTPRDPHGTASNHQVAPLPRVVSAGVLELSKHAFPTAHAQLSAVCCYHKLAAGPLPWQNTVELSLQS